MKYGANNASSFGSVQCLFLLPVPGQARYWKRINSLRRAGLETTIAAFHRPYYDAPTNENTGIIDLGQVSHGHYLARFWRLSRAAFRIRRVLVDIRGVYVFGLDMLLVARLASIGYRKQRPRIIYEVGDIREVLLGNGVVARFLRLLERWLLRRVTLIVSTAPAFISEYYKKVLHSTTPYLVIENKVVAESTPPSAVRSEQASLCIGYFGLLRSPRSLKILTRLVEQFPENFTVSLRGIPFGSVAEIGDQTLPGIAYHGPFSSPEDLAEIYSKIDISWIVAKYHGGQPGNLRWARTNRFYEACFFKVPMIAQQGTEDGRMVEEMGLGLSLDLSDVPAAVEHIARISQADIQFWRGNLAQLPSQFYTLSDEHIQIVEALSEMQL